MSDFDDLVNMLEEFGIEYEGGHFCDDDEENMWLTIKESELRFSPKGELMEL